MKLSDFSKAKVGNTCFDIEIGEAKIFAMGLGQYQYMTIQNEKGIMAFRTIHGKKFHDDALSTTYWKKPEFEVPEMPKRMIKLKKWIGVYKQSNEEIIYSTSHFMYETEEDAKRYCAGTDKHIPIEFEVEE